MSCSTTRNPCPIYIDTNCIVYSGSLLSCIGAYTNDRLSSILSKIDTKLCQTLSWQGSLNTSSTLTKNNIVDGQTFNFTWNSSGIFSLGYDTISFPSYPNSDTTKALSTDADGNLIFVDAGGGGGGGEFDIMSVFLNNVNSSLEAGVTEYTSLSGGTINSTLINRVVIFPNSGYLKNFFVFASGTQPASGNIVITFMKGTTPASILNTTLSVTIPANTNASTGTIYSDTLSSIPVNAGDIAVVSLVNNASVTSLNIISISATYTNQA